jgi:hypothetical protein
MPFLTINWVAPYSMGLMPADSGVVFDTPLTVPWNVKQSTYVLPYDTADLTVKPAPGAPTPEPPVIVNPPDVPAPSPPGTIGGGGPGGAGTTPAPAPAPGAVRPAVPPRVVTLSRISPAAYRSRGIRVRITVPEKARVVVHLEARMKRRATSRRRATTAVRRLTKQRAVTLKAGTTTLRLSPTIGGRQAMVPGRERLPQSHQHRRAL